MYGYVSDFVPTRFAVLPFDSIPTKFPSPSPTTKHVMSDWDTATVVIGSKAARARAAKSETEINSESKSESCVGVGADVCFVDNSSNVGFSHKERRILSAC